MEMYTIILMLIRWKRANALHEVVTISFQAISRSDKENPTWFSTRNHL